MKLSKFMLAENPMLPESGEYILHTQKPRMLLEVLDLTDVDESIEINLKKQIPVGATTEVGDEYYLIYLVLQFDEIKDEGQQTADELAKLMRRAADWWHALRKFENELDKE